MPDPSSHRIRQATESDLPFIEETVSRLRLDGENLRPEQFIVVEEGDRAVAFGRVKPYERTFELGCVAVVEDRRHRGLGELVVRELTRRFPQDQVFVTTDLPDYFRALGFLPTESLPPELDAKVRRVDGALRSGVVGMIYDRRIERLPALADVFRARQTISRYLPRTPLVRNPQLSAMLEAEVYLKLETLQPTGAFKVRGGIYFASTLSADERSRGIAGASTGNHGQSLAYGANLFGVRCLIAMPRGANRLKVDAIRALGADVHFHGSDFEQARSWAEDFARRESMRFVHHINTPALVAGVATMSLEIMEDQPDVDVIINPVGGGSGAAGHCLVAKTMRPEVQVIGVQAEGAPAVYRSWKERRLALSGIDTIAEGLATGEAHYLAVKIFIDRLDDLVLVSEDDMRAAVALLLESSRQLAEPAGAAATAAALKLGDRLRGKKVAIVVTGGNMTLEQLRDVLSKGRAK